MQPTTTAALIVFAYAAIYHWPEFTRFLRNRSRKRRRAESKRAKVLPIERHPRLGREYLEEY